MSVNKSIDRSFSRRFRDFGKDKVLRRMLELGQGARLSIVPLHYYSEVPNLRQLKRDVGWREPSQLREIAGSELSDQVRVSNEIFAPGDSQATANEENLFQRACEAEGSAGYSPIDAVFLYRFLSNVSPRRVIQIGAGVSTSVAIQWVQNTGADCTIVCIEPYPSDFLRKSEREGLIVLRNEKAQVTPEAVFKELDDGDLLFIDSTHTTVPGSEVNRLILEILPILNAGVWVHFHDIWFPYQYRPDVLTRDLFFWRETLLLQAYLSGNSHYELKASLSMLHHGDPSALQALVPMYEPRPRDGGLMPDFSGHYPCACYIQRR